MKPISPQLANHMNSEVTTLATCWKLTRSDDVVLGFTSHDRDIIFAQIIYKANSGFVPTSIASTCELSVDNMEIEGVVDGVFIKEEDIIAGRYDFAKIEIFMLNYNNIAHGQINLRSGWLGEIQYGKGRLTAEVRGLMQSMVQIVGELYSPSCRAKFCDEKCGLDIINYTVAGNITSLHNNQVFQDTTRIEASGYFSMGKITFHSGNNSGLAMEVKEYNAGGMITLVLPMPYIIKIGDAYSMQAGCDKSFATCVSSFNNAINFRGEPHVPGIDAMLKTAGTK